MENTIRSKIHLWLPLLIGLAMLPIPLLRDFHIESALLVSLAGCFWAAWYSCKKGVEKSDSRRIFSILGVLYLTGVPLLIYSLVVGCLSWHGIGFWILYPIPSVLLGYSLGRLLRLWSVSYRQWIACAILLFIAIGILLIEFFNLPQVYFFNHVWGGWPGPIYDETVKVTWSLVFYRGLTLAWIGLLWWIPTFGQSKKAKLLVAFCLILLVAGYSQLAEMGIITPRSYLQQQLGGEKETPHFMLYYDREYYTPKEIDFWAARHEFYFRQIVNRLQIEWPDESSKIESYLYAHPWQKKELVGAKFTSYVPVWLDQDQLHIARSQLAGSLKHELVHVLAKQFGNVLFNASWSIGLIEGLAVAVAPDESGVTTIDQIVVSEKPYPTAEDMQHALSPLGFYGGRSAVNYTQTGSFVQYLINNYPVDRIKQAYRQSNVQGTYQISLGNLVTGWHNMLDTVSVDSTDQRIAARLYGFPSLFEKKCPHVQSHFAQLWDRYKFYMAEEDTTKALKYLGKARRESPDNLFVKNQWAFLNLISGNLSTVQQQASKADSSADGLLLYADAFAMNGKMKTAQAFVSQAEQLLEIQPDSSLQKALQIRRDTMQWRYYRQMMYQNRAVSDSVFEGLAHRTQARAIQQAIDNRRWKRMKRYAGVAADSKKDVRYFDTYLHSIKWLAFLGEYRLAEDWLEQVANMPLRVRYWQRAYQTEQWIRFLREYE